MSLHCTLLCMWVFTGVMSSLKLGKSKKLSLSVAHQKNNGKLQKSRKFSVPLKLKNGNAKKNIVVGLHVNCIKLLSKLLNY